MKIYTSISPNRIEDQLTAIRSWLNCGFEVVSINSLSELEGIEDNFENIEFILKQDEGLTKLSEIFAQLSPLENFGIVNSDVQLKGITPELIESNIDKSLIFGNRINVEEDREQVYFLGFDYFFLNASLINNIPENDFCLGMPGWDYFLPLMLKNKTKLLFNTSKIAFHNKHEVTYSDKQWAERIKELAKLTKLSVNEESNEELSRTANTIREIILEDVKNIQIIQEDREESVPAKSNKKLLVYVLFDNNKQKNERFWDKHETQKDRYWCNIPAVVIANQILFPEYKNRIYINSSIKNHKLFPILSIFDEVIEIDYEGEDQLPTTWRMLPLWEEGVECFFCKDIDSIATSMEAKANRIFESVPFRVQTLRSILGHQLNRTMIIMAGLCGFKPRELRNLIPRSYSDYIRNYKLHDKKRGAGWEIDQILLKHYFVENRKLRDYILDVPLNDALRFNEFHHPFTPEVIKEFELNVNPAFLQLIDRITSWPGEPIDTRDYLMSFMRFRTEATKKIIRIFDEHQTIRSFYVEKNSASIRRPRLLIKFPTRGRPDKFFKVLDKYINMLSGNYDYQVVVSCDVNDTSMNNNDVRMRLKNYKNLFVYYGSNKTKVQAINVDLTKHGNFDILLLASDDMEPQVPNYDQIIFNNMRKYYPDYDGVLFFNDGFKGKTLNTLSILGKKYYDRFKYVYHPSYISTWCDNEFTDVAYLLKRQTYIDQVIIKHLHPFNINQQPDRLNVENDRSLQRDKKNYLKRKGRNFDIKPHDIGRRNISQQELNEYEAIKQGNFKSPVRNITIISPKGGRIKTGLPIEIAFSCKEITEVDLYYADINNNHTSSSIIASDITIDSNEKRITWVPKRIPHKSIKIKVIDKKNNFWALSNLLEVQDSNYINVTGAFLSLLIYPTSADLGNFQKNHSKLVKQVGDCKLGGKVEVLYDVNHGNITELKNNLVNKSGGMFSCLINDKIEIKDNFVRSIFDAISANPDVDCFGIRGHVEELRSDLINSINFQDIKEPEIYLGPPTDVNPIQTAILRNFPFVEGEKDEEFSERIRGALHIEKMIDDSIYNVISEDDENPGNIISYVVRNEEQRQKQQDNQKEIIIRHIVKKVARVGYGIKLRFIARDIAKIQIYIIKDNKEELIGTNIRATGDEQIFNWIPKSKHAGKDIRVKFQEDGGKTQKISDWSIIIIKNQLKELNF